MPSPSAILRLIRWQNTLIAAAGVFIGAWWVGGDPLSRGPILVALAAIALAALANSYNDLVDVEIDRIAHPDRPLPSGAMSVRFARGISTVAIALALVFTAMTGTSLALVTIAVILAMILYSRRLKRAGFLGNATVAVLASMPFLYGGWSVGRPGASLLLMMLAVPLHLAREIAKDMDDIAGDAGLRRTIPVVWGHRGARNALLGSYGAFLGVLFAFASTRPLFAIAVIPAVALATYAAFRAAQGARGAPRFFKLAMLCAMAALFVIRQQ